MGDNWTVKVTPIDDQGLNGSGVLSNQITVGQIGILPTSSGFDGQTTNFIQEEDLTSVENLILENTSHGIIKFGLQSINVSGADLDTHVQFLL